jgi:peptide alpha-N-acetyltransferase
MSELKVEDIQYISYSGEKDLHLVSSLIEKELSEPYSVFTYRYFVNQWPELCILVCSQSPACFIQRIFHIYPSVFYVQAMAGDKSVGTIVCKLEDGKNRRKRGYIGMLAVDPAWRGKRIGNNSTSFIPYPAHT